MYAHTYEGKMITDEDGKKAFFNDSFIFYFMHTGVLTACLSA